LIAGPSAEERQRGLVSFIPPGTELLSAMIRGTTAYINLNEEFQFSTFGVEGYAAQLRQIVWTATEFSTVKDVQILIEGKRVDYLGESILIGSPISRDMLP
ncbi:MAG: GerMN domain-containing protein, partial [Spirochaetaceae bacterium]|nr:GerMN domain-containing protein [Spirochaetaceae bacterium]